MWIISPELAIVQFTTDRRGGDTWCECRHGRVRGGEVVGAQAESCLEGRTDNRGKLEWRSGQARTAGCTYTADVRMLQSGYARRETQEICDLLLMTCV